MYSSCEVLQGGSHYSGYWMGTVMSKADLTSALRLIITDCKNVICKNHPGVVTCAHL